MPSNELIRVIYDAGMSSRPAFYSGRGATLSDLSHTHLTKLYNGIKTQFGEDAARNFVVMVATLPILAATDFLLSLFKLEEKSWKWTRKDLPKSPAGTVVDAENPEAMVIQVLFGGPTPNHAGQTEAIRNPFLWYHEEELKAAGLVHKTVREGADSEYGWESFTISKKWVFKERVPRKAKRESTCLV